MLRADNLSGFTPVCSGDAACIFGGVDKKAQDALYTIGYIVGIIAKFFVMLFTFNNKKQA